MTPLERFRYIRSLRMPGIPKAVLWVLASHADRKGLCWPSRQLLADESGFSYGAVYEALQWLTAHGLVIQYRRRGQSSTFTLTLESFRLAQSTPSPPDGPPRHLVTAEVDQLKGTTQKQRRKARFITPRNVVALFPESKR